jgi:hypothetical protein
VIDVAPFRCKRPEPEPMRRLGDDEDWTKAAARALPTRGFDPA